MTIYIFNIFEKIARDLFCSHNIIQMILIHKSGTIIRNNTFKFSKYNIGRFKSNGGSITNNTFSLTGSHNLEITPLLQYFEGNLPLVKNIIVADNTFIGEGEYPIHCSPFCQGKCQPGTGCSNCTLCSTDTPWASNVSVTGNVMKNVTTI